MSITDVLSRISQIEQQVSSLESGSLTSGGTVTTAEASNADSSSSTGSTGSTSGTSFSDALAQAQASDPSATTASVDTPTSTPDSTADSSLASDLTGSGSADSALATGAGTSTATSAFPALADSALGQMATGATTTPASTTAATAAVTEPSGGIAVPFTTPTTTAETSTYTPPATTGGVTLPANAGTMLTSEQQQFASTLSAETGLNPGVVSSWLLAEESGGAAQSRQAAGNNDWLNVGYTDSGTFGADDTVWSDPTTAATATADWLKGEDSVPGYGTASSGIQSILDTVGQTPQTQIQALQTSGWSGSGYPSLPELYSSVTGG